MQSAQTLTKTPVTNLVQKQVRLRWLRSLMRSPVGLTGMILVIMMVIMALAAPLLAPHDPAKINIKARLAPPAWSQGGDPAFLLGTDQLGRDLLSRIIYGSRISLLIGLGGVVVAMVVGVFLGLLSGFFGGLLDTIISRMLDTFMAIPFIILALAVMGVLGVKGGNNVLRLIVVLALANWVIFTRVVRGDVLSVKARDYVEAARAIGQSTPKILWRYILPNVAASIIVLATLQIATVIIAEASLSFLGLGVQPPTITWGIMLADGRDHLATSWWLSTFPGIAITLTVLGIILWGDWLRDILDPRLKT
ncbi:MAG: ABC transporter permease [Anaerolineae bacterium]